MALKVDENDDDDDDDDYDDEWPQHTFPPSVVSLDGPTDREKKNGARAHQGPCLSFPGLSHELSAVYDNSSNLDSSEFFLC